jgi:hypothetical protein
MAYHEHDIREKFLVVGNKRSIVDLPAEVGQKITSFAGRLGDDIVENKRVLREAKEYFESLKDEFSSKELIIEKLAFIDGYLGTSVSHVEDDADSGVPASFLESLFPHAKNKIIKIDFPYNFLQLKTIMMQYYRETGKLVFPISKGLRTDGKIIGVLRSGSKVKVPVVVLHKIVGGENPQFAPFLFGETPHRKSPREELAGYFYLYRFVGDDDEPYTLLSDQKLKLQSYSVEGSVFEVKDSSLIGEVSKIPVKYKVLFLHTAKPHVIEFKSHDEFFSFCDDKNITEHDLLHYIVSLKDGNKIKVFSHPVWFLQLLLAFLFHAKKGETDKFPMHLLWIAPRGTGKSTCLEAIMQKFGEKIVDGSTSTLKFLIPSFKERNNPEIGELARAHRLVVVDEFFRMLLKSKNNERNVEVARMNILLEHKERAAGSGHGTTIVKMTARMMASTNPVSGTNNIYNLLDRFDDSFLSRMIIYYQLPEHLEYVNEAKKSRFKRSEFWIEPNEFISIVDYLNSFDADYDWDRLVQLYEKFSTPLSQEVKGMFEARYLHHLECMLDGIVKMRCLFERDKSFAAIERDYELLDLLFGNIIRSWFNDVQDVVLDVNVLAEAREHFLPEDAKVILSILQRLGLSVKISELKQACLSEMREETFYTMLSLLRTGEFVHEEHNRIEHYSMRVEGGK